MAEYKFVPRWSLQGDDVRQIGLAGLAEPGVDEALVEARFDTLWESLKPYYPEELTLDGYAFYEGPVRDGNHWEWGDAFRLTDRNVAGTSNLPMLPPQCAVVVSFPMGTVHKRHRGRVYMPTPGIFSLSGAGRFLHHSEFADAWKVFLDGCAADDWHPSVLAWVNGVKSMLSITEIRVDDVFDTQRRRGYEQALATAIRAIVNP
jgi:hypothetical protein